MSDRMPDEEILPPAKVLTLLESARVGFEAAGLMMSTMLLSRAPRGDGHTVLVLPGFATNDHATLLLRLFLTSRGYDVRTWDLGWNLDHRTIGVNGEHVLRRIDHLHAVSGGPISLVGWSLGGVIAREAARAASEHIRMVITLGSPFRGDPTANAIGGLYELLSGNKVDSPTALRRFAAGDQPLSMPSTAIYSRTDGIAAWQNCRGPTGALSENIEVRSSHFGMVANPAVFHVVADRLSQATGSWTRFDRRGFFASLYPDEVVASD